MQNGTQAVPTNCPQCGARFAAHFTPIVDVGRTPELKRLFLQGRLNVAACPQCGSQGLINAPFLYHDPEKEMLLVFMPQDLQLRGRDEQRIIGDMTNSLLASLPPEARKGYLLQPKTFLTLQSLLKEVMNAEGITDEVIEAQAAKSRLIGKLLSANSREELQKLVGENESELDYQFFQVLLSMIEEAAEEGQDQLAQQLGALGVVLAEMSEKAREAATQAGMGVMLSQDELADKIMETTDQDELERLIVAARPMLDYSFFQALTNRIEKAQQEGRSDEAERLRKGRSLILNTTARLEKQARAAVQQAAELLGEVVRSDDPEKVLRDNLERIDEPFMMVLSANIQDAQQKGQVGVAEALSRIAAIIFTLLEEQLPPELRFINQLLRLSYPEGTRQFLESNRAMLTPQVIGEMNKLAERLTANGQTEALQHLKLVMDQARALTQEQIVISKR